jgi:hypothetical protein
MNIQNIVAANLNLAWSLLEDLVRPVVFYKITGYTQGDGVTETNLATASVNAISLAYQSRDIDGESIINGDEKWLVRASELSDISPIPSSGDWFEEVGIRHEILAANRDATQSIWTFQVRRQFLDPAAAADGSEDWGDIVLGAATETEDWGSLSLYDSDEDWMN